MGSASAQLLADLIENTRDLVFFYIKDIPENNWHTDFEVNGKRLNSVAWQLLHLAWGQNFLILQACGAEQETIPEFELVKIGAEQCMSSQLPEVNKLKEILEKVHLKAVSFVRSLTEEQLEEKNLCNMKFKRGESKKACLFHHLRHEGTHIGQLSVLAKLHGVKTI